MQKTIQKRITAVFMALTIVFLLIPVFMAQPIQVRAVSADYPAILLRISTSDNSRNINISGYDEKSACVASELKNTQNENWRFDYVGTDSKGSFYRIVNMGTGQPLTPMNYSTDENTNCVIFGYTGEKAQHWYVIPVEQDKYGNDLYYKIVNYTNTDIALTNSSNKIKLSKYAGNSNQKWLLNPAGLQGFGGYAKDMSGNVKAAVLGGTLAKIVEVTTFDELKAACTSVEPMTIVITKDITAKGNYTKDSNGRYRFNDGIIYMQPNKTVVGSYGAHSLYNVYFRTYNENFGPGHNLIFRNMEIKHDKDLNNDNIMEFAYGSNYWIDHITFVGHDKMKDASTGLDDWDKFLNFKIDTNLITISDCRYGLHEYGVLLGYPADDAETYAKYNGIPLTTLANNYYKDTFTRAPALMRYGYFHSLNNYVYNFSMGYTVHTASKIYAENCYYDGSTTNGNVICDWNEITYFGSYAEDGSIFKNCRRTTIEGKAQICTWRPTQNYSYSSLTAEKAKSYCEKYSGCQNSTANYTYAVFTKTGYPSAGYLTKAVGTMEEEQTEPLNGNLIQNLIITDSTKKSWNIDTDLQSGDLVFGDRDVVWNTVPEILKGSEAIVTACDAKNSTGDSLATFSAGADMTVWIALDNRVENIPVWMNSYQKSNLIMNNNKDVIFNLYQKPVRKGENVTLGANGQSAYCVNYAVFATDVNKTLFGDVNDDGIVNVSDIKALQNWLHKKGSLKNNKSADINADGIVNIYDLVLLKKMLLNTSAVQQETQPVTETAVKNSYEPEDFKFSGTVYLVGDSTVCEYDKNTNDSLNRYGWGMKFAEQYQNVTVKNLALSGRSSRSFLTEKNYQTLISSINKGDYLFIQFGHNDEKTDESTYPGLGTYPNLDMSTLDSDGKNTQNQYSYEWILLNKYIKIAQNKGAVPVLITPITRRNLDGTANYQQHTSYQQALINLGKENHIAVIDMTALTTHLYTSLYNYGGADETAKIHCYSDTAKTTLDNTHLSNAGAYKIASMIAEQTQVLELTIGENKN